MALIEIYADTRGKARCRSCEARIEWATVVKSGKKMPFDGEIVPVRSYHEGPDSFTGRLIEVVDTTVTTSHFATCPQSDRWRKK